LIREKRNKRREIERKERERERERGREREREKEREINAGIALTLIPWGTFPRLAPLLVDLKRIAGLRRIFLSLGPGQRIQQLGQCSRKNERERERMKTSFSARAAPFPTIQRSQTKNKFAENYGSLCAKFKRVITYDIA
jgi:hypothetical protein